ncbi:hypothetical protein FQR65_LT07855 [Abscondita terminalis]|nr:hypothetical protein FQR65_LT07855 [Abscondita terminalis]
MCKIPIFLIIIVHSLPSNYKQRHAVRTTWGSYQHNGFPIKIYFLVNKSLHHQIQIKIHQENYTHNDIFQGTFHESSDYVFEKLLSWINLFASRCGVQIKYLIKTHDNTYVNVPAVLAKLAKIDLLKKENSSFKRDQFNTLLNFPEDLFKIGYLTSIETFKEAIKSKIIQQKDIYITELCQMQSSALSKIDACNLLTVTAECNFSPPQMIVIFKEVQKKWADRSCLTDVTIVDGWNVGTSRNINIYIYPNKTTTVIKPESLCKSKTFLMVVVCSSPSNFEQRIGIRESWGLDRNISNSAISLYFLLGLTKNNTVQDTINIENQVYGDVVQEDFVDTYNNLTIKSLMLLKLIRDECAEQVQFVMKMDDDTFVNMPNLIETLQKERAPLLMGKLITKSKPIRDYNDKWYVPKYMYPKAIYPNYLSGTAYIMTTDVAIKLFDTALQVPLIHLEDVYLTGICAKLAYIRPKMNPNFNTLPIKFDPCHYRNLITCHYITPIEMRFLYYRVKNKNLEQECNIKKLKMKKHSPKTHFTVNNATSYSIDSPVGYY